jgi:hypothetical protein
MVSSARPATAGSLVLWTVPSRLYVVLKARVLGTPGTSGSLVGRMSWVAVGRYRLSYVVTFLVYALVRLPS